MSIAFRSFTKNAIEASATNPGQWVQLYIRSEVRVNANGRTKRWRISRRDWLAIRRLVWRLNMVAAGYEGEKAVDSAKEESDGR